MLHVATCMTFPSLLLLPSSVSPPAQELLHTEPPAETHLQEICLRVSSLQSSAISHQLGPHHGLHVSHRPLRCRDEKAFEAYTRTHRLIQQIFLTLLALTVSLQTHLVETMSFFSGCGGLSKSQTSLFCSVWHRSSLFALSLTGRQPRIIDSASWV